MKNKIVLALSAVVLLAAMSMSLTSCGEPGGDTSVIYRSADANNSYELEIIKSGARAAYSPKGGDDYIMTVTDRSDGSSKRSDGKVSAVNGGRFTLEKDGRSFEVTCTGGAMTEITGDIPLNDGTTITSPGAVSKLGTFTLTGIPAQYDGWEAAIDYEGEISNFGLVSLISGGKVVIPLFDSRSGSQVGYSGNDTIVDFEVLLGPPPVLSWEKVLLLSTVKFSNGSAERKWSDGEVKDW